MGHDAFGGKRTFDYVVKLSKAGAVDLGELALPYWDPDQKRYDVARAALGSVTVAPSAAGAAASSDAPPELLPGLPGPRAALDGARSARAHADDSPLFWIAGVAAWPLAFGLAVAGRRLGARVLGAWRSRRASPAAELKERIAAAHAACASSDPRAADAAIARALEAAAVAHAGVNVRASVGAEVVDRLERAGVDRGAAAGLAELLRECESARFAPDAADVRAARERWARAQRVVRRLGALVVLAALAMPASARGADEAPADLQRAAAALRDGRASDAIASLEALADQGVVDGAASYDRGLAYAARVRIGAEVPGDLGRAAHGFEEAREISRDPRLVEDASRALTVVRGEVARRRVRAGEPVEVDAGRSLARTVAGLLGEDAWAYSAAGGSALLALGLFAWWLARAHRLRIAGGVAAGVAAPVLLLAVAMTLTSRRDRESLREAVVVSATARPSDERGVVLPGATPLPEGARVELVDARGGWSRVRFGAIDAWLTSGALRELARRE
jgi:hypothetical protein